MKIIAITGNIACGKTTLLNAFSKKFPIFNCDNEISNLYQTPKIIQEIIKIFPEIFPNGFNKANLKSAILKNEIKIKTLQKILYPHLYKKMNDFIKTNRQKNQKIIFIENPLVFETRKTHNYDDIILVNLPIYKRKQIFAKRNNDLNLWKIATQNQWPHTKKIGTNTKAKKIEFFLQSTKFQNKEIHKLLQNII